MAKKKRNRKQKSKQNPNQQQSNAQQKTAENKPTPPKQAPTKPARNKKLADVIAIPNAISLWSLFGVCVTVLAMSFAFKVHPMVWRGVHDTLVFKNSVVVFLCAFIAIYLVFSILRKRTMALPTDPLSLGLFALLGFAALSFFWSDRPGYATHKTLMWASGVLTFIACLQFVQNPKYREILFKVIFITAVMIAFLGLLQALFNYRGIPQATAPASTFSNKNMANHPLILSLPLMLYMLFRAPARHFLVDVVYAIGIAIVLGFVFQAQTRAAWLAMGIQVLLIFAFIAGHWWSNSKKESADQVNLFHFAQPRRIATGIGVLVLLLIMFLEHNPDANSSLKFVNPAEKIVSQVDQSVGELATVETKGSFGARKDIWRAAVNMAKERPLTGQGMGNFYDAYQYHALAKRESFRRVHNDFLEMITEIGLIGFAIFMLCMLIALYYFYRLWRAPAAVEHKFLLVALFTLFLGTSVNAFFSFPYFHITPMILMGIYMAMLVNMYWQYCRNNEEDENALLASMEQNKFKPILFAVGLAVFAFIGIRAKYHVEHMEVTWSKQIQSGQWKHMNFRDPDWLETTHYMPVLQGMYGLLNRQYNDFDNRIKAEKDFNKRMELQKQKAAKGKMMEDVAKNISEYNPRLSMIISLTKHYMAKKDYASAKKQLELANKVRGKGTIYPDLMLLHIVRTEQGDAAGLKFFNERLKTYTDQELASSPNNYRSIGTRYLQMKQSQQALQYFKKGLQAFPNNLLYLKDISKLYIQQKRGKEALPYLEQYLELAPENETHYRYFNNQYRSLSKQ